MVLLLPVAIGFVLGLVLGGRPAGWPSCSCAACWLLAVAFGLQVLAFPLVVPAVEHRRGRRDQRSGSARTRCSSLIAVCNRHVRGFGLLALGMLSNLIAIVANGGHMPALPSAMTDAGVALRRRRT